MPKIFISYRRVDSAGYTQAIYSRLVQQFSQDEIFIDVDTIAPGADFERAIERAVADCDVLVAVIGKRWITAEPNAPSRFENTKDYVALEISTALARDVHVIPVLVDGTTMPREENLPFPVRPITRRQAIEISNTRFKFDVERLLTAVRNAVGEPAEIQRSGPISRVETQRLQGSSPRRVAFGAVAAGLVLIFASAWWLKPSKQEQLETAREISALNKKADDPKRVEPALGREPTKESPTRRTVALPPGSVFRDRLKNGREGPEMVVIPAGSFRMGNLHRVDKRTIPVHTVRIQKSFALGRYEVTFTEYEQFALSTNRPFPPDEGWGRARRPVIYISWQDAVSYAKWLSVQSGKRYRLPNEAEWEYAARGGKETAYWWGEDWQNGMANCSDCGSAWDKQTAPVGSFKPNPFGLYDTAGNVWEWVEECWHDNYSGAPTDGSGWISGGNCTRRVRRGGAWSHSQRFSRSSTRERLYPDNHSETTGFRILRELD
jgi:formylglycine-generating enzyme required for sulfatase activity